MKKLQDLYVKYVWPATSWLNGPNRRNDGRPLRDIVRLLRQLRTQCEKLLGPWGTKLYINGVLQRVGTGSDYTIIGQTITGLKSVEIDITWLESAGCAIDMDTNDVIVAKYECGIPHYVLPFRILPFRRFR